MASPGSTGSMPVRAARTPAPGRLTDREAVSGWAVAFAAWCLTFASIMFNGPGLGDPLDPSTLHPVARLASASLGVALYSVVPAALVGVAVVMVLNRWPRRALPEIAHVGLYAVVPYVLLAGLGAGRAALFGEPVAPVWTEPIGLALTVAPALCSAIGRAAVIPLRRGRSKRLTGSEM